MIKLSKQKFLTPRKWQQRTQEKFDQAQKILDEYSDQGYKITLRQLYYELVSKNIIANDQKEYNNLGTLINDARYYGYVDWEIMEDNVRTLNYSGFYDNIAHLIDNSIDSYRLDRWQNQDYYVEVWVEKDALSSFIKRVTNQYQIPLMVNRGYSSATAMYKSSLRFNRKTYQDQKNCILLYLGDHDPSGLNMIEDIDNRLNTFECSVKIVHVALTMEQIEQYNPSPNPAKITDSRSKGYIRKYGNKSWEIEALKPTTLIELVESYIKKYLDEDKFQKIIDKENNDKKRLKDIVYRDFDN
ncbi:MAG: hypothetical protein OES15_03155 [Nitrosopumilus sp.]|nr:hypothetical protein [Nitrosopumilus sp.]MDH3852971.1 hypothetical protein [Nitrosopumilus sp.]